MRRKNRLVTFVVLSILAIILLIGMFYYLSFLKKTLLEQNFEGLREINTQQIISVEQRLLANEHTIENLADLLEVLPLEQSSSASIAVPLMREYIDSTDFDYLVFADLSGTVLFGGNGELGIQDREYFQLALAGKTVTSDILVSKIGGSNIVCVSTPVYKDQTLKGVLVGLYNPDTLTSLLSSSAGNQGFSFLTTRNGIIIATSTPQSALLPGRNWLDYVKEATFEPAFADYYGILKRLYEGEKGSFVYALNGQSRVGVFASTKLNGWGVFTIIPSSTLFNKTIELIQNFTALSTIAFFLLFVYSVSHLLQLRRYAKALERSIYVDELTGGNTLAKFKRLVAPLVERTTSVAYVLCKVDIRNFRIINGIYGYEQGDRILKALYQAIDSSLQPKREYCARVNVDEVLFIQELQEEHSFLEQYQSLHDRIMVLLGHDFANQCNLQLAMGYDVVAKGSKMNVEFLIERVNMAHRKAKQSGAVWAKYQEGYTIEKRDQVEFERLMEQALHQEDYQVYLQPKCRTTTQEVLGYEALVRWVDARGTLIPPSRFIPVFEENGFIIKLDFYIFQQVCKIQQRFQEAGMPLVPISVNFSRHHLLNPQFAMELAKMADSFGIPHALLEIEMLESSAFQQDELFRKVYAQLHELGFVLALDDFGSGYSSLGFLKSIPVDVLKLDRSFFAMQAGNERGGTVLTHLVAMAKALHMRVVAEGIEREDQLELLQTIDCTIAQGYYFGKPKPWIEYVSAKE